MRAGVRAFLVFLAVVAVANTLFAAWRGGTTGYELISGYNEDVHIVVEIGRFGPRGDEVVDRLYDRTLAGLSRSRFRRLMTAPGELSYRVKIESDHCSAETMFGYIDGLALEAGREYVFLISGWVSRLNNVPPQACAVDAITLL